jgi:hypothetical protein
MATKEILQRIFPDIRIEDDEVKWKYFMSCHVMERENCIL